MDIIRLLEELEEIIEESSGVPFSKKIKVDKEEIGDIITEIKYKLPEELKEAQYISSRSDEIIEKAKREADKMMSDVKVHIESVIDESKIVSQAEEKAEKILKKAELEAREIKAGANIYAEELLTEVEEDISKTKGLMEEIIEEIRENKKQLK